MLKQILPILLFAIFCFANPAFASDVGFNPNYIISDADILDSKAMSLEDIHALLREKKSFLANYFTLDSYGVKKHAAEIIYNAAANNYDCSDAKLSDNPGWAERKTKCSPIKINPKFLIVLLQKEQGLIENGSPTERQLDWATGYACPDSGGCNERWRGFGKQVNSAALQFYDYMANPHLYTYKAANVYNIRDNHKGNKPKSTLVKPSNIATAALYNYTPHVYYGNYNFYKIWQRYFDASDGLGLIEGSLVQAEGELGVWLIQNGKKRPFLSSGALTSRYDKNKIITISASDLAGYPRGAAIKFPQYSIVQSPNGSMYLLVDDKKRLIADAETFRQIGFNPEEIINASWEDINAYQDGQTITRASAYPTGALLQDKATGGVYWVSNGVKYPLLDAIFLKTKYKNYTIIQTDKTKLDQYAKGAPVAFEDGELLKSSNSSAVYVISGGKKRPITSGKVFEEIGYKWENIITVSPKVLYLYENGEAIS